MTLLQKAATALLALTLISGCAATQPVQPCKVPPVVAHPALADVHFQPCKVNGKLGQYCVDSTNFKALVTDINELRHEAGRSN